MTPGTAVTKWVALAIVGLVASGSGCGGGQTGTPLPVGPASTGTATGSSPPAPAKARFAVDPPASGMRAWADPRIRRDGHGGYLAGMRASTGNAAPVSIRLSGIGFPGQGTANGRRWVGPAAELASSGTAQNRYTASVVLKGRDVSLYVWSRGGDWRATADGRPLTATAVPAGRDHAFHRLAVHFATSRRRVVRFQLANGVWIAGVQAGRHDALSPPAPPSPARPSVYWLGDSFSVGAGSTSPGFTDLVQQVAGRLGVDELTVDALGGTGYVKTNYVGRFPNYLTRAKANVKRLSPAPDVVVVAGSINDSGESPSKTGEAAADLFATIAETAPQARIFVVPFTSRYPVPSGIQQATAGVAKAARAAPNVAGVLDLPSEVQAASGPTTAAGLQRSDGHPTPAGHKRYARLIADFLTRRDPAFKRPSG